MQFVNFMCFINYDSCEAVKGKLKGTKHTIIRQQPLPDLFHIKADFYSRSGRPSPKKAPKVTTIGISNRVSDTPRSYERAPKVSATLTKANG